MVKMLDDAFQLLIDDLTPDNSGVPVPAPYQEVIRECLDQTFGLYAFFLGGSLLSNTNIQGYGGVDYFASVVEDHVPDDSDLFLAQAEEALRSCFPNAVAKAPAVVIPSGAGDSPLRVVPAKLAGETSASHRLYAVADGMGGWMDSSPHAHRAYVEALDHQLGGKLRPLVRLLKAWKLYRQVPVSSFYIELRCVEYAFDEKMIVYTVDFPNVLQLFWQDQFADVHDPKGIAGRVPARLTRAGKKAAISKLRTALYHTSRAQEAEAEGDIEEAFVYWNRVFKGHFPAYG
jgi:hypothetical protein